MENFEKILQNLIEKKGLSLRKLALESDVSAMKYSRYLHGTVPTIDSVIKIAKYFNCSLDYLFGLDKNKINKKYSTYEYDLTNFVKRYEKLLEENNSNNFKYTRSNKFGKNLIYHWREGKIPKPDTLYKLAITLNSSIDYLIGRK